MRPECEQAAVFLSCRIGIVSALAEEKGWGRGGYDRIAHLPHAEFLKVLFASKLWASVPVVPHLDRRILDIVDKRQGTLRMSSWHSGNPCGTTHCRAGWAITLGEENPEACQMSGKQLEDRCSSPATAGGLIYFKSVGYIPSFYAPDSSAMEDMRRRAAE